MSTTAVRCLRATPTARSILALSRRNPLSTTVATTLGRIEGGRCSQLLLRPVVAVAASLDLASLARRVNGNGLNGGFLMSQANASPTSSFIDRVYVGGDGNLTAAMPEMVAVNRNARRPKKVSTNYSRYCCCRNSLCRTRRLPLQQYTRYRVPGPTIQYASFYYVISTACSLVYSGCYVCYCTLLYCTRYKYIVLLVARTEVQACQDNVRSTRYCRSFFDPIGDCKANSHAVGLEDRKSRFPIHYLFDGMCLDTFLVVSRIEFVFLFCFCALSGSV